MSSNPPNNEINELLRLLQQQQQWVPQHQEQHQPTSMPQINNQGVALPPDPGTSAEYLMALQGGAAMIGAPMAATPHLQVNSNDPSSNAQQILPMQQQQQQPPWQKQGQIQPASISQVNNQGFALPPGPGTSASLQNLLVDYLKASQAGAARLRTTMGVNPMGAAPHLQVNPGAPIQALSTLTEEQQTLLKLSSLLSTINQSLIAEQVQRLLNPNQQRPQDMMTNSGINQEIINQAQVSISDFMMKPYQ